MFRRGTLLGILATCVIGASGAVAQRVVFTNLGSEDGMGAGGVAGIQQDSEGFIWTLDREGLKRYDGYELLRFHLPDRYPELNSIELRWDFSHLNAEGAERWSRRFAAEFADWLDAGAPR